VSKLGNDLKWNPRAPECLTGLINEGYGGIAKETRCLMDMRDAIGFKTHYPGAGCICGNCIVCENEGPQWPRSSVQWSISFHGHDTIGDHKINRDSRANIQNALLLC
jgi:hypothetical protein